MDRTQFDKEVEKTLETIRTKLIEKGKEYDRNGNPFHNFDKGAKMKGLSRERVIESYSLKHEVSIDDLINDIEAGNMPTLEMIEEKFVDAINYLVLKKISLIDKIDGYLPF